PLTGSAAVTRPPPLPPAFPSPALFRSLNVSVSTAGAGDGIVSSAPSGILCGPTCSAVFPAGSAVGLSAPPSSGSMFVGWGGGGWVGRQPCAVPGTAPAAGPATSSPPTT